MREVKMERQFQGKSKIEIQKPAKSQKPEKTKTYRQPEQKGKDKKRNPKNRQRVQNTSQEIRITTLSKPEKLQYLAMWRTNQRLFKV